MDTATERERGVTEPRDQHEANEVVENYRQPAGIGIDDFRNKEPRWTFADWLMLGLSILAAASLVLFLLPPEGK